MEMSNRVDHLKAALDIKVEQEQVEQVTRVPLDLDIKVVLDIKAVVELHTGAEVEQPTRVEVEAEVEPTKAEPATKVALDQVTKAATLE